MGTLLMSAKERLRLKVLAGVADGSTSLPDAAARLGLSYRQMRRVRRRHAREGDGGLVHKLRGKASNRRTPAPERTREDRDSFDYEPFRSSLRSDAGVQ